MKINSKVRERRRRLGIALLAAMVAMALLGMTDPIMKSGLAVLLAYWTLFALVSFAVILIALRDIFETRFHYSIENRILKYKLSNDPSIAKSGAAPEARPDKDEIGDNRRER